jgi:hypothetical protein
VATPPRPIYDTPPQITGVTPGDIPALSGQVVTITGTNFGHAGTLTICQGSNCICPGPTCTISAWKDNGTAAEVDVVVDASGTAPGPYTFTLSTLTDYLSNQFSAMPGSSATPPWTRGSWRVSSRNLTTGRNSGKGS